MNSDFIKSIALENGNLTSGGWQYVDWSIGEDSATLDGDFSVDELRAIADHMDLHNKLKQ